MTRKLVVFHLSVLALLAMTTASEASIQSRLGSRGDLHLAWVSSQVGASESIESADRGGDWAMGGFDTPFLAADANVKSINPNVLGLISFCDLTAASDARRVQRQALPEPATLTIWSLIGLCWMGANCWRRRRGLLQGGVDRNRPRLHRGSSRPPWPDHVRVAILEIIERGCPH
jgi:hypothetical protein